MTGKVSAQAKQDVINVMADLCEEDPSTLDDLFQELLKKNLYAPSKFGFRTASPWVNKPVMQDYYWRLGLKGGVLHPYVCFDRYITGKYCINGSAKISFDTLEEAKEYCDERLRRKKYVLQ